MSLPAVEAAWLSSSTIQLGSVSTAAPACGFMRIDHDFLGERFPMSFHGHALISPAQPNQLVALIFN
jgi:hypothetical protein